MNFCTKCASYYARPGTCNCFAEPNAGAGGWQYPIYPQQPTTGDPYPNSHPSPYTSGSGTTVTITQSGDGQWSDCLARYVSGNSSGGSA